MPENFEILLSEQLDQLSESLSDDEKQVLHFVTIYLSDKHPLINGVAELQRQIKLTREYSLQKSKLNLYQPKLMSAKELTL